MFVTSVRIATRMRADLDNETLRVPSGRASVPHSVRRLPQRPVRAGGVLRAVTMARLRPRRPHVHGSEASAVLRSPAVYSSRTAHHQSRARRLAVPEPRL